MMWGFEVGLAPSGITLICWPASTNLSYWTPSSDILVATQRQRIQLNSMPEASSPSSIVIGLTEPTTASPVQLNLTNILFRFYANESVYKHTDKDDTSSEIFIYFLHGFPEDVRIA